MFSFFKWSISESVYIFFVGLWLGEVGGGDAIFVGLHVIVFFP